MKEFEATHLVKIKKI